MTTYAVTQELIDTAVAFHGHWCPGLSLGIRAAAWAKDKFGTAADEEIVVITETDMCAVDAIQAIIGCTFGKGNLIFRDKGKVAFSFYRRSDGTQARIVEKQRKDGQTLRRRELQQLLSDQKLTAEKRTELEAELALLRKQHLDFLLSAPFEDIFDIKEPMETMPAMARRLPTIICDCCGEGVMATRIVSRHGKQLCMDCTEKAE